MRFIRILTELSLELSYLRASLSSLRQSPNVLNARNSPRECSSRIHPRTSLFGSPSNNRDFHPLFTTHRTFQPKTLSYRTNVAPTIRLACERSKGRFGRWLRLLKAVPVDDVRSYLGNDAKCPLRPRARGREEVIEKEEAIYPFRLCLKPTYRAVPAPVTHIAAARGLLVMFQLLKGHGRNGTQAHPATRRGTRKEDRDLRKNVDYRTSARERTTMTTMTITARSMCELTAGAPRVFLLPATRNFAHERFVHVQPPCNDRYRRRDPRGGHNLVLTPLSTQASNPR